jgi:putative transcriptional regulator
VSAAHPDDLLAELAAGALSPADREAVDRHLAGCARCRLELGRLAEAAGLLAVALQPVASPPGARERLLAAAATGRLHAFAARVAAMLDVAADEARRLLDAIDTPAPWTAGPTPAIQLFHLTTGPAVAAALAGFVRVKAGERFPYHRHLGEEQVLVLQGGLRDDDGTVLRRGDVARAPADSAHSFVALPGPDLVYLVVLQGGVEIPGYTSDV